MLPCAQTHKVWLVQLGSVGSDPQVQHSRSALVWLVLVQSSLVCFRLVQSSLV